MRVSPLLAALAAAGCGGTETGNPTEPGQITAAALTSDPDAVAVGDGDTPLVVTGYNVLLGTLGYQPCPANTETVINLLRVPRGEWICIQAQTLVGPASGGIAEARIYDADGLVGRSTQSLAIRLRG